MPRQEAQTGGPDRRPRNHKKGAGEETGRTEEGGKRLKTYAKRYEKTKGGHKNEAEGPEGPEAPSTTGGGQHLLRKPVKMTERTHGEGRARKHTQNAMKNSRGNTRMRWGGRKRQAHFGFQKIC